MPSTTRRDSLCTQLPVGVYPRSFDVVTMPMKNTGHQLYSVTIATTQTPHLVRLEPTWKSGDGQVKVRVLLTHNQSLSQGNAGFRTHGDVHYVVREMRRATNTERVVKRGKVFRL